MTPRVVLDANVIVSGLGWSGPPARIIDAALDGQLVLVTSPPLLAELRRVLGYPKLAKVLDGAQQLAMRSRSLILGADAPPRRAQEVREQGIALLVGAPINIVDHAHHERGGGNRVRRRVLWFHNAAAGLRV